MNIKESILKFRSPEYNYSCSESIARTMDEYYNLGLEESHFKMMAPYSGGLMSEDACGIVTGALAILGFRFTVDKAKTSPILQEAVQEYLKRFKEELKTINCYLLKQEYKDEVLGCNSIIVRGAELLVEVIDTYDTL